MKKNIERIILLILLLGTMTIIFGFSSQDGKESGNISKKITEQIVKRIPQIQEKEQEEKEIIINRIEKVIRKIAHFSIYTVVGIIVMAFISTYQIKEKNRIIISTITALLLYYFYFKITIVLWIFLSFYIKLCILLNYYLI